MLNTDLRGVMENCKNNKLCHLILLLGVCVCLYILLSKYMKNRSTFNNVVIFPGMVSNNMNMSYSNCDKDIPRMDEAMIRNTINLPNRNPALMTSSMVYPEPSKPSNEDIKRTRMDILNMFYSSFDDDLTTIRARPQNLYVIP